MGVNLKEALEIGPDSPDDKRNLFDDNFRGLEKLQGL